MLFSTVASLPFLLQNFIKPHLHRRYQIVCVEISKIIFHSNSITYFFNKIRTSAGNRKIYSQKEAKELELSYDELEENNIHLKGDSEIKSLEENQSFFDIIDFLKPEDRTIISMFYLDGYTTREISVILKLNESTLRSRISSIKEKIRQRYGKEE